MTIKNWTVVTERVKDGASGLHTYQSYLTSSNHKNHKDTDILPITDNQSEFFGYAAENAMRRDAENTKGGRRVASYAQGFNLTLPHEFQPSHAQWKMIFLKVREELKEHLGCDNSCFYANVHKENKKNSHMNLLVSRCHQGKVLDKLDQKSTLALTKRAFTNAVLNVCKISTDMYEKKSKDKRLRKRLTNNAYAFKQKKQKEELDLIVKKHSAFANLMRSTKDVLEKNQEIKDEVLQVKLNIPQREKQIIIDKSLKLR